MTDTFGDIEPEDSWHPDDDVHVLVDNLFRRLVLLRVERQHDDNRPIEQLADEVFELVEVARARRDLDARDELRIRHLDDDLAHIMERLH